jgi:hypothetical protein
MAYFPDLSPYAYGHHAHPGVVHVGWLDNVHHFTHGTVETRLIEKMKLLAAKPVELCFGSHVCELCVQPPDLVKAKLTNEKLMWEWAKQLSVDVEPPSRPDLVELRNNKLWLEWVEQRSGNGEMRVSHRGITFAAPVLIVHYIEEHGYLPPSDFLKAVEEGEYAEAETLDAEALLLHAKDVTDQKLKAVQKPTEDSSDGLEDHATAEGIRLREPTHGKLRLIGTAIGVVVVILLAVWMAYH